MRLGQLAVSLAALAIAATSLAAQRPGIRYDAITGDRIEILGLFPMAVGPADSAFIWVYRTFLPPGDTVAARQEALPWWPWFVGQMSRGTYHRAAIWVLWPKAVDDSLFEQGPGASYAIQFVTDSLGCWRVVNDTTQVQRCARESTTSGAPR